MLLINGRRAVLVSVARGTTQILKKVVRSPSGLVPGHGRGTGDERRKGGFVIYYTLYRVSRLWCL